MDVLDIRQRYDALELERVNLEEFYGDLQARLADLDDDDASETADLLRRTINALNVEREHSSKLFALVADLSVGWVEERQAARKESDGGST